MATPLVGESTILHVPAVRGDGANLGIVGTAQDGWAVSGESKKQVGVRGICEDGWGVSGDSKTQIGVRGYCEPGWGVAGESKAGLGVRGICESGAGVYGGSQTADGVFGSSENGRGVVGVAKVATGVEGNSASGAGVFGSSQTGIGVFGRGGQLAGLFEGDVNVTNTLTVGVDIVLANADCAEDFDIAGLEKVEPGTVMVIDSEGKLRSSDQAYDKRVAGVISGAGKYKPGIVLDKQESSNIRMPIALLGKVYCKVDANYGAIEVGDLLTTSPTLGHAMKVDDPFKALGTIIGKALCPREKGQGLIPILIALQ